MRRKWIEEALEGTGWTFEEVQQGIDRGDFHLFECEGGCLVGEYIVSPRHTVFNVWAGGGSLSAIKTLIPVAEAFAKRNNCDVAGATGRKGWVRIVEKFGYKQSTPAVEKEL